MKGTKEAIKFWKDSLRLALKNGDTMYAMYCDKMINKLKNIYDNPSIHIYEYANENDVIDIVAHERELTLDYLSYWIRKLMKAYKDKENKFIIMIEGYSIDGLSETNYHLIKSGSVLWDIYTNQYRTLKI